MKLWAVALLVAVVVGVGGSLVGANDVNVLYVAVAADAAAEEEYAAQSLAHVLALAIGEFGSVSVVNVQEASGHPHIAVGVGAALAANVTLADLATLGPDDALCRRQLLDSPHGALVLTGGAIETENDDPKAQVRGTINAVFEYLRRIGFRFYAPDGFNPVLPNNLTPATALNPPASVQCGTWAPSVAVRTLNGFSTRGNYSWLLANHLNGVEAASWRLPPQMGGSSYYAGGFVHTSLTLVPPCPGYGTSGAIATRCNASDANALNNSHPAWFGGWWQDGRSGRGQLCWMNKSMQAYLIGKVQQELRANPLSTIISVSQVDDRNYCQRPADLAVIEEEGSPAAPMLRAVNAVGAAIAAEFPHVIVSTLAYQYSRPPPNRTVPRENVAIRLCDINANFAEPLTAPSNTDFVADLEGWRNITNDGQLHIWSYARVDDCGVCALSTRELAGAVQILIRTFPHLSGRILTTFWSPFPTSTPSARMCSGLRRTKSGVFSSRRRRDTPRWRWTSSAAGSPRR